VDAVFEFRALTPLQAVARRWLPGLPDPTRAVLDRAIRAARSVQIQVRDTQR
jgi:hypothetical protein